MEALQYGDGLLRSGVPDVHLRQRSDLTRCDDVLVFRMLIDTERYDVIRVMQVEALIGCERTYSANEKEAVFGCKISLSAFGKQPFNYVNRWDCCSRKTTMDKSMFDKGPTKKM